MSYIKKYKCIECGKEFLLLPELIDEKRSPLCAKCDELKGVDPLIKEDILPLLDLYKAGKVTHQYKIEEDSDEEDEKESLKKDRE